MATDVRQIMVGSEAELRSAINDYTVRGFVVVSREPGQVGLKKAKEFNVVWAVIGFALCLLPLLVYLVVYATQSDEVVTLHLRPQLHISEDGRLWWDGLRWLALSAASLPPGTQLSPDGQQLWDGQCWRPVATSPTSGAPFVPPTMPPAE